MIRKRIRVARFPGAVLLSGLLVAATLAGGALAAQSSEGGVAAQLKQKLAAVKASAAANQKRLHQYTWTETSQITVNGNAKPAKVSDCSYGPDGKVVKVPVGGQAQPAANEQRGGRLREHLIAMKTAEMKDYMQQVGGVIQKYIPPDAQKMEAAFQQHKVTLGHANGLTELVFRDYAQSGDSMTVGFDPAARKIRTVSVHTYLDPQDPVSLVVDFATLPDGTNHPSRTTLDASAKGIHVVNINSNYRKAAR